MTIRCFLIWIPTAKVEFFKLLSVNFHNVYLRKEVVVTTEIRTRNQRLSKDRTIWTQKRKWCAEKKFLVDRFCILVNDYRNSRQIPIFAQNVWLQAQKLITKSFIENAKSQKPKLHSHETASVMCSIMSGYMVMLTCQIPPPPSQSLKNVCERGGENFGA